MPCLIRDRDKDEDAEALLGGAEPIAMSVSKAFKFYCDQIATSNLLGKLDAQKHSWQKVKNRAVNNFISICGDLPMDKITRKHAQQFREWWTGRLRPKGGKKALNLSTANRDIGNMRVLYQACWDYEGDTKRPLPAAESGATNPNQHAGAGRSTRLS